ncbi:MAG: PIG-L family deacetylase [Ilumatobacteraceae bacterium]
MTVAVISPHLDDAVLSVGATIHNLTQRGDDVEVITLFAGDPARPGAPSYWDKPRRAATSADVIRERRAEDQQACDLLGVKPVWLPFDEEAVLAKRDPDAMWDTLGPLLQTASLVMLPGWPLDHADHRYATTLVLDRLPKHQPVMFYGELPTARSATAIVKSLTRGKALPWLLHALGDEMRWFTPQLSRRDVDAKMRAIAAYPGEVIALGLSARPRSLQRFAFQRELLAHRASQAPDQRFATRS